MNPAFERHAAYMEQAWRTLGDSLLLKMLPDAARRNHILSGCPGCPKCQAPLGVNDPGHHEDLRARTQMYLEAARTEEKRRRTDATRNIGPQPPVSDDHPQEEEEAIPVGGGRITGDDKWWLKIRPPNSRDYERRRGR